MTWRNVTFAGIALILSLGSASTPEATAKALPVITSISWTASDPYGSTGQIVIEGSGFGNARPYSGDGNHLRLHDSTRNFDVGWFHCWNGCPDWIVVNVTSWTDNRIVISKIDQSVFYAGDHVDIYVSNARDKEPPVGSGDSAIMTSATHVTWIMPGQGMAQNLPRPATSSGQFLFWSMLIVLVVLCAVGGPIMVGALMSGFVLVGIGSCTMTCSGAPANPLTHYNPWDSCSPTMLEFLLAWAIVSAVIYVIGMLIAFFAEN